MNGMWGTLAAEVLDFDHLDKVQYCRNFGTWNKPEWKPVDESRGIIRPVEYGKGRSIAEFIPIPELRLERIG